MDVREGHIMNKRVVKKGVGPHFGLVSNSKTFDQAFNYICANPHVQYMSTGNCTPFICKAYVTTKGRHKGEKKRFIKASSNTVCAYAYADCWGKKTNCYGSYIDCYTKAL